MFYGKVDILNAKEVISYIEKLKSEISCEKKLYDEIDSFLFLENNISMYNNPLKFEGKKAFFYEKISDDLIIEAHVSLSDNLLELYNIFEGDFPAEERINAYEEIERIKEEAVKASLKEDFTGRLKILLQAVTMNYKESVINFIYRGVSLKDENIC